MEENTRIFAMNALLSSMQIFNIKEKLQEDMLQVRGVQTQRAAVSVDTHLPLFPAHASLHILWRDH